MVRDHQIGPSVAVDVADREAGRGAFDRVGGGQVAVGSPLLLACRSTETLSSAALATADRSFHLR